MKSALAVIALATILVGCQNTSPPLRGVSEPATASAPGSISTVTLTVVTAIFDDSIEEAYFKEHLTKIARNLIAELDAIRRPPIGRFSVQINIREDGSFSVLQSSPNIVFTPFFDAMVRAIKSAAPFPPWTSQMKEFAAGSFTATIGFDTTPQAPQFLIRPAEHR